MFFACLIHVWVCIACRFRSVLRILGNVAFLEVIWAVTFVPVVMILFIFVVRLLAENPWLGHWLHFVFTDTLILNWLIVVLVSLVWFWVKYLSVHEMTCRFRVTWLHDFRFFSLNSVFLACKHLAEVLTLLLHVKFGVLGKRENVEREHWLRVKLVAVVLLNLQQLELVWLLSRIWNRLHTVFHLLHNVFVLQTHYIVLLSLDVCVE